MSFLNLSKLTKKIFLLTAIVAATAGAGIVGCDDGSSAGGGNNNNGAPTVGTGTGNPQTDTFLTFQQTNSEVNATLPKLLQNGNGQAIVKNTTLNQAVGPTTYNCINGGTLSVAGDVTNSGADFSFNVDFDFNCTNLDGKINVTGKESVDLNTQAISYDYTLDGQVGGNGCTVDYDKFSINLDIAGQAYTFLLNGTFSSDCNGTKVTCTFNNTDLLNTVATSVCK